MMVQKDKAKLQTRKGMSQWVLLSLAGIVVIVIVSMVIGIFTAPQIGGVYSKVTTGLGSGGTTNESSYYIPPAGATTAAAAATTAAPAATAMAGSVAASAPADKTVANNVPAAQIPDRMIIRNATFSIQSENVEKSLADIRALVVAQQGTVFSSNTNLKNEKTYATMVIQVPSSAYDTTMAQLRQIAFKVDSEVSTSQDVTEEFADGESQLRNLRATEAQFLELLKKTASVTDTIQVQNQLTNVRGQIEKIQGRLNYLQKKSDYSTITINIAPTPEKVKEDPNKANKELIGIMLGNSPRGLYDMVAGYWDVNKVFENAWSGSMRGLRGLATVAINISVYLMWLGPLALIAGAMLWLTWRKVLPRKRTGKETATLVDA